jgi:transcription elongation GreA/GreB family factor
MKEIQYLDLILNGILKNERFLKNYIIRKQKEAENKNYISEAEFFEKCNETISLLENKFEAQSQEKRRKIHDSIVRLQTKVNFS